MFKEDLYSFLLSCHLAQGPHWGHRDRAAPGSAPTQEAEEGVSLSGERTPRFPTQEAEEAVSLSGERTPRSLSSA